MPECPPGAALPAESRDLSAANGDGRVSLATSRPSAGTYGPHCPTALLQALKVGDDGIEVLVGN